MSASRKWPHLAWASLKDEGPGLHSSRLAPPGQHALRPGHSLPALLSCQVAIQVQGNSQMVKSEDCPDLHALGSIWEPVSFVTAPHAQGSRKGHVSHKSHGAQRLPAVASHQVLRVVPSLFLFSNGKVSIGYTFNQLYWITILKFYNYKILAVDLQWNMSQVVKIIHNSQWRLENFLTILNIEGNSMVRSKTITFSVDRETHIW